MTKKNPNGILTSLDGRIARLERKVGLLEVAVAKVETELKMHRYYIPIIITVVLFILKYVFKL